MAPGGLSAQLVEALDLTNVKFTMLCPFGLELELEGTRVDCGTVLVVTVVPGSLSVVAAEEVVYRLCRVLRR